MTQVKKFKILNSEDAIWGGIPPQSADAVTPTSPLVYRIWYCCIVLSAPEVDSASLLYGSRMWQMYIKNFQLHLWPWKDWLNKGISLGISIGLHLSLFFWLWWFISQQLLYPLPNPFLPKAQWGTKEEVQEANDAFEVNYISFILFCCVQCDLSYQRYYPEGLTVPCSSAQYGEAATFRSHGLQHSQGCLPLCLQAKWMKASSSTDEQNCHIYGHWGYSNWLNLEPAQNDNIILILFFPFVWHLVHEEKDTLAVVNHCNLRNDSGETTSKNHSQDTEQDREKCYLSDVWGRSN